MYTDETGGADNATSTDITVESDGQTYTAEATEDIDHDGVADTAVVYNDDGTASAFADTDHDGDADEYATIDSSGNVTEHAYHDEATGDWVDAGDTGGTGTTPASTDSSSGGSIHADLPDGEVEVGPATVDTNGDGVPDTAMTQDSDGNTIGFTDVNGDGEADVAVVIAPDGSTTVLEHTGAGNWEATTDYSGVAGQTQSAMSAPPGTDNAWSGGGQGGQPVEGVAKIDTATGQWISQN